MTVVEMTVVEVTVGFDLRDGWPKCCGATMMIDPPEEWSEHH